MRAEAFSNEAAKPSRNTIDRLTFIRINSAEQANPALFIGKALVILDVMESVPGSAMQTFLSVQHRDL